MDVHIPLTDSGLDSENNVRQCRICLDEDTDMSAAERKSMIAPCHCAGSNKWVHRACLDSWRATNTDGRAFTHCSVCGFEYVVERVDDEHGVMWCQTRRARFLMLVARDSMACFLLLQLVIILLGLLVHVCDPDHTLVGIFPSFMSDHVKTTYYLCGLVLFLAMLGVVGCAAWCSGVSLDEIGQGGHRDRHGRHHRRNDDCCDGPCYCNGPCYCDAGDCSGCHCGGGGGGGNDGEACLIIMLVVILLLAFIGVFVAIVFGTMLIQRIMQRHMRVLWLSHEAKRFHVVDFAGREHEMPRLPSAPPAEDDAGWASAGQRRNSGDYSAAASASAPDRQDMRPSKSVFPSAPPSAMEFHEEIEHGRVVIRPPGGPGVSYPSGLF